MAGFKFTLQQVLEYRGQLKEQAQVELARAQAELTREEARARELRASIEHSEQRMFTIGVNNPDERWLLEHFIKGLRTDEASTHMRIRLLAETRRLAQEDLASRAKDEKVLDKLKEKQAERYAADERLKEMKNYDETAAIRFKPSTL